MTKMETVIVNGKEVKVYKKKPAGWEKTEGTLTQPRGTVWINNGESLFAKNKNGTPKRKIALLITDEELWNDRKKNKAEKYPIIKKSTCKSSAKKKGTRK